MFWKLPSTVGKLAKKDTSAGGVAFNISSNALVVPEPNNPMMGLDMLEAVANPGVVLGEIPVSRIKKTTIILWLILWESGSNCLELWNITSIKLKNLHCKRN